MQAVILAGGLGTRLRPLTLDTPKPMIKIAGKPFLEYKLRHLKRNGFRDFVLCVGYKSEVIEEYFESGDKLGISISYSNDGETQRGPVGALKHASELLENEFMVTYGDDFLRLDYACFQREFCSSGKLGMMAVLENHSKYGKSDILVENGLVTGYDKVRQLSGMIWINFGATLLKKSTLKFIPDEMPIEEEQFYRLLIAERELAAFVVTERFYEIGSIPGLQEFEKFALENPDLLN